MKQNKRIRTVNGYTAAMRKPARRVFVGRLPGGDLCIVFRIRDKNGRRTQRLRLSPEAWGAVFYCGCRALEVDAMNLGYETALKIREDEQREAKQGVEDPK